MKIPRDKQLHILAGVLGGVGIIGLFLVTLLVSLAWAVFVGVAGMAAAKEGLDKWLHGGTSEWADFAYTVAGGTVVALLVWAFT